MLTGEGICKSFRGTTVLDGVSATVAPGEITVAIGPSGSGKSTLLRALSLLDPPDRGTVTVDSVAYPHPRPESEPPIAPPWPKVTVVFQSLFLWPHLTVRENIALPLKNRRDIDAPALIEELIDQYKMGGYVDRYPNEASVGQKQRAAIARAVALRPKYLLLDEVTSALDVEYVAVVLNHLLALKKQGTGILLITHLIGFARRAADRILFLEQGRVVEEGGRDVLASPRTSRLREFVSLVDTAS